MIALAAALAGAMVARHLGRAPPALQNGTLLPEARAVADFQLQDQDGQPFGLAQLRGAPSLVFFGFTHCPDVCPATLALLAGVQRDPALQALRVVFVTVDPGRDDTPTLRNYVRAFSPTMVGLRGDETQLQKLMGTLGAVSAITPTAGGGYTVDHSAGLFLVDAQGRLAGVFTPPFNLDVLRADLARAIAR